MAGIAGACLLGAGAGLWARPAAEDQREAAPPPQYVTKSAQKLEIVLTDPLGAATTPATAPAIEGPTVSAEMLALDEIAAAPEPLPPMRAPSGLMKVQDVRPVEVLPLPEPEKVEKAKPPTPKVVKARAGKKPDAKSRKDTSKVAQAKREKAKAKPDVKLAKAAEEASVPAADETKRPGRIARLKTVVAKPFKDRRKADPAEETKVAKAATEKTAGPKSKTPAGEVRLAKAEPPKAKAPSKRCVSSDPGAAIVCADPSLSAADRQLSRAYREAEAAGVPAWQLRQQQQRWLAARAAAAREAPWAVHDVYLARIAELNDMTRDARDGY